MTYQFMVRPPAIGRYADMQVVDGASEFEVLLAAHAAEGMPPLLLPGCWDGLSARVIERAGYHAAWIDREAVARAKFGHDGRELVTATMMASVVADIRDAGELALAVDAGNGFGNAFNVGRTVATLEAAGAQAIQLEDEFAAGRVGDARRATADMIGKVKAAVDAARGVLLIARAGRQPRESLNALMDRVSAYAEAGADLIGIGGALSTPELGRLASWARQRVPLVVESNQPFEAGSFDHVAVVCQPMLFQQQAVALVETSLAPPPRAAVQREPETLRHLAS